MHPYSAAQFSCLLSLISNLIGFVFLSGPHNTDCLTFIEVCPLSLFINVPHVLKICTFQVMRVVLYVCPLDQASYSLPLLFIFFAHLTYQLLG